MNNGKWVSAKIEKIQKSLLARISWPLMPRMPQGTWLRTHPPTDERIRRLLALRDQGRRDPAVSHPVGLAPQFHTLKIFSNGF